jgi:hypothetical protein
VAFVRSGRIVDEAMTSAYDSGYVNAILQLKTHINSFIDKPNSQIAKVFELMDFMIEGNEVKNDR